MSDSAGEKRAVPPWTKIRRVYENDLERKVREICVDFGITMSMLYTRARREGWKRRHIRGARLRAENEPLARLKTRIRQELEALEHGRAPKGGADAKRLAAMTALVRLLERIANLEQKEKTAKSVPPPIITDAGRLRLARKLEGLRRELEGERNLQPTDGSREG